MKLHDFEISGNGYRVRLFLSLLGLQADTVRVDLPAGAQRAPAFLKLNPRGQVPVLEDDGNVIWDSMAILVYLARKYGGERWLPLEAVPMAQVMQWLAVMQNETLYGMARARVIAKLGRPGNLEEAQTLGRKGLAVMEERLSASDWLASDHPTIADVGCLPYVAMAPDGGISLESYPAVRAWLARMAALPGYVAPPSI